MSDGQTERRERAEPTHGFPRDARNVAQRQEGLAREVVGRQQVVVHHGEVHASAVTSALLRSETTEINRNKIHVNILVEIVKRNRRIPDSQLEALVEGGVEGLLDDVRLLCGVLREEMLRTELHHHVRVTQTVGVQR